MFEFTEDKALDRIAEKLLKRLVPALANGNGKAYPRLLTVAQAAEYLGRSKSGIEHLIFNDQIPVVRTGRRVHLDRLQLDEWIRNNSG